MFFSQTTNRFASRVVSSVLIRAVSHTSPDTSRRREAAAAGQQLLRITCCVCMRGDEENGVIGEKYGVGFFSEFLIKLAVDVK